MKKAIIIAYILFICVYEFLPKSVETGVFLLFVLGSAWYIFKHKNYFHALYQKDPDFEKLRRFFICFLCLSALYLLISFLNLPRIWGIKDLRFSRSYIPRHFIIIAEFCLPICLADSLLKTKLLYSVKASSLILFFLVVLLFSRGLCSKGLLVFSLVLLSWKLEKRLLVLPAILIHHAQSSYVVAYLILVFIVYLEKPITRYLFKNTARKIIAIMSLAIIGVFLLSGILAVYVQSDANSLWRLRVWENEMRSLWQTGLTGVGFGSAYVTDDIVNVVRNSNMYYDNADHSLESGVFLVANHSSLVNMFYRMGLVGGLMFLALNIQLIKTVVRVYYRGNKRERSLLWRIFAIWAYETVIVFLNPGLEMMQFAITYLLSVSFLLAVVFGIQNRISLSPQRIHQ